MSVCPAGAPLVGIFCDNFESGNLATWSTTTNGPLRTLTQYAYREGKLLAALELGGSFRDFGLDHLGTIRAAADAVLGEISARHTYFPFGREATSTDQDDEVMKFTGHERDLQSTTTSTLDDLDYMHARYRSPLTSRFLSTDPILGTPALPQSWNRYAYTLGNPLRLVDPDGRSALKRGIQVLKMLADKEKRTVLLASFRSKSERAALTKTRSALDSISGEKRIVETQTAGQRDAVGRGLSSNGEVRGPESSPGYPEHVNPAEGPYSDVHVQVQGQRRSGSGRARSENGFIAATGGGLLGEIFAPTTSAISASGDASPSELMSAAIWDATSTLDPTGLTDLIGMYYDLP